MSYITHQGKLVTSNNKYVNYKIPQETAQDIDGNIYNIVTIGTQKWAASNLKTTTYADGISIPEIDASAAWLADTTGAYCENPALDTDLYGRYYNWYSVNNAHGLAPSGWRIPSLTDWQTLVTFAGGGTVAGGKLKEIGTLHWNSPNTGATDDYGFKLLPAGRRDFFGNFAEAYTIAYLWSSTTGIFTTSWALGALYNDAGMIETQYDRYMGFSVRFMKDV
jgi:uncharacterized protein (TIGR02145 family)